MQSRVDLCFLLTEQEKLETCLVCKESRALCRSFISLNSDYNKTNKLKHAKASQLCRECIWFKHNMNGHDAMISSLLFRIIGFEGDILLDTNSLEKSSSYTLDAITCGIKERHRETFIFRREFRYPEACLNNYYVDNKKKIIYYSFKMYFLNKAKINISNMFSFLKD